MLFIEFFSFKRWESTRGLRQQFSNQNIYEVFETRRSRFAHKLQKSSNQVIAYLNNKLFCPVPQFSVFMNALVCVCATVKSITKQVIVWCSVYLDSIMCSYTLWFSTNKNPVCSLICLLHTAHFARAPHRAPRHSFLCSFAHSLPSSWGK